MEIRDLDPEAPEEREACARLLVEEFRDIVVLRRLRRRSQRGGWAPVITA